MNVVSIIKKGWILFKLIMNNYKTNPPILKIHCVRMTMGFRAFPCQGKYAQKQTK